MFLGLIGFVIWFFVLRKGPNPSEKVITTPPADVVPTIPIDNTQNKSIAPMQNTTAPTPTVSKHVTPATSISEYIKKLNLEKK